MSRSLNANAPAGQGGGDASGEGAWQATHHPQASKSLPICDPPAKPPRFAYRLFTWRQCPKCGHRAEHFRFPVVSEPKSERRWAAWWRNQGLPLPSPLIWPRTSGPRADRQRSRPALTPAAGERVV